MKFSLSPVLHIIQNFVTWITLQCRDPGFLSRLDISFFHWGASFLHPWFSKSCKVNKIVPHYRYMLNLSLRICNEAKDLKLLARNKSPSSVISWILSIKLYRIHFWKNTDLERSRLRLFNECRCFRPWHRSLNPSSVADTHL